MTTSPSPEEQILIVARKALQQAAKAAQQLPEKSRALVLQLAVDECIDGLRGRCGPEEAEFLPLLREYMQVAGAHELEMMLTSSKR